MTGLALALVLSSAVLHAFWNLTTKRVNGGVEAVWLFTMVSTSVFAPVALVVVLFERPHIGPVEALFLAGSGFLQIVYFVTLSKGYLIADLSVIYPLARGTGPLLATTLAITLLGERPSIFTIGGAILICLGVFLIAAAGRKTANKASMTAIGFGVGTGLVIGLYTVWDGHAVSALAIPAVLLGWSGDITRAICLTPFARGHWLRVLELWSGHRRSIIIVGVLSPLSYMMVLTAMSFSPVSSIAPAREVSILFGAMLGFWLLKEPVQLNRILAALSIVAGVVAVVLG